MNPFDDEARYYDIFHRDKDYESEAKELRRRYPNAKTVLEIGCGTGNLTRELEKLDFKITCIEPSGKMLKYFGGAQTKPIRTTIQDYVLPDGEFDLVLATYDILNYISWDEIQKVLSKISDAGRQVYVETWDVSASVRFLTYKRVNGHHRVRLGFRLLDTVFLWFIFWGQGLVISYHKLYLHRLYS